MTTMAVAFLVIFAVAVAGAWADARYRAWHAARRTAATRHPSRRRCLSRWPVPGLPTDGEPLTAAELYQFTGIMLRPARDPETGHGPGQDERETR